MIRGTANAERHRQSGKQRRSVGLQPHEVHTERDAATFVRITTPRTTGHVKFQYAAAQFRDPMADIRNIERTKNSDPPSQAKT